MKIRLWHVIVTAAIVAVGGLLLSWYGPGPLRKEQAIVIARGASLSEIAHTLEQEGAISSAWFFRGQARGYMLLQRTSLKAGEFMIPPRASPAKIFSILASGKFLYRSITIPEGMPSVLVAERLRAEPLLTGKIAVPAEGSVLPDSYAFQRGEARSAVLARMQAAMTKIVTELWAKRDPSTPVKSIHEAITLASIVEKEAGNAAELKMVAGLYSNRLRAGMRLQADPTIIYPITLGKPLGRRIRRSEILAHNDYNTYAMTGLPKGPITNPGRQAIAAALNPAKTSALYMVADGSGGHVFSQTLNEHNRNVAKWYALRRQRGEME